MVEEGGRDATEAFEDVGHSDEARDMLVKMLVGQLAEGENVSVSCSIWDGVEYTSWEHYAEKDE